MSKKANPAIIGAFVIGAILLSIVALLAFAGGKLFRDTSTLVTYFEGRCGDCGSARTSLSVA